MIGASFGMIILLVVLAVGVAARLPHANHGRDELESVEKAVEPSNEATVAFEPPMRVVAEARDAAVGQPAEEAAIEQVAKVTEGQAATGHQPGGVREQQLADPGSLLRTGEFGKFASGASLNGPLEVGLVATENGGGASFGGMASYRGDTPRSMDEAAFSSVAFGSGSETRGGGGGMASSHIFDHQGPYGMPIEPSRAPAYGGTSKWAGLSNADLVNRISQLENQLQRTSADGGSGTTGAPGAASGIWQDLPPNMTMRSQGTAPQAPEDKCLHLQQRLEAMEKEFREAQEAARMLQQKYDQCELELKDREQRLVTAIQQVRELKERAAWLEVFESAVATIYHLWRVSGMGSIVSPGLLCGIVWLAKVAFVGTPAAARETDRYSTDRCYFQLGSRISALESQGPNDVDDIRSGTGKAGLKVAQETVQALRQLHAEDLITPQAKVRLLAEVVKSDGGTMPERAYELLLQNYPYHDAESWDDFATLIACESKCLEEDLPDRISKEPPGQNPSPNRSAQSMSGAVSAFMEAQPSERADSVYRHRNSGAGR